MFDYKPASDLLSNRSILITGAGDGIGKACARAFVSHGARVILLSRNQEKLEKLYDELEPAYPGMTTLHPMDLGQSNDADYETLAKSLDSQFPQLDGLLHNAGVLGARSPIEHYPCKDWREVIEVNINAAFYLTRALLPALSRSADARLLFTSSSVGRIGRAYWGAYATSKFAVEGLMQTIADELGSTSAIRVNSINPGGTRTAMRQAACPAEDPESQPSAESLMPVYLYLMGPDSKDMHGQALNARGFAVND